MMRSDITCLCCGGAGKVTAVDGRLRPCSRCNAEAFDKWSDRLAAEHRLQQRYGPILGIERLSDVDLQRRLAE